MEDLDKAHALLNPLLGSAIAPALFAIALLCCGLNSTITATMAGQIVMEGFIDIRLKPWIRARHYALRRHRARRNCDDPLWFAGNDRTSDPLASGAEPSAPFAVIPLVIFTAQKKKMGSLAAAPWVTFLAAITAAIIVVLNLKLIYDFFTGAPI